LTLQEIRSQVTQTGRAILDQCWGEYKKSGRPIAVRDIYRTHSRPDTEAALKRLGGSLLRESSAGGIPGRAYQISYLGALLSSDGERLQKILERFVTALQKAYEMNYGRALISSEELNAYARLPDDELFDLGRLLRLDIRFLDTYLGGLNADGSWQLAIGDGLEDVRRIPEVTTFVEQEVLKVFDPHEPVSDVDRMNRALKEQQSPYEQGDREKQQKFGILDAPNLLSKDLDLESGKLGRAVIYLDLDDFKAINTKLTEVVVDELILPLIHKLLKACVGGNGYAYAEGGDEFTILLPNASRLMAIALAESIRTEIEQLRFTDSASELRITGSLGVAHEGPGQLGAHLAKRANEAKSSAKQLKKNCVVLWRPDGSTAILVDFK